MFYPEGCMKTKAAVLGYSYELDFWTFDQVTMMGFYSVQHDINIGFLSKTFYRELSRVLILSSVIIGKQIRLIFET